MLVNEQAAEQAAAAEKVAAEQAADPPAEQAADPPAGAAEVQAAAEPPAEQAADPPAEQAADPPADPGTKMDTSDDDIIEMKELLAEDNVVSPQRKLESAEREFEAVLAAAAAKHNVKIKRNDDLVNRLLTDAFVIVDDDDNDDDNDGVSTSPRGRTGNDRPQACQTRRCGSSCATTTTSRCCACPTRNNTRGSVRFNFLILLLATDFMQEIFNVVAAART